MASYVAAIDQGTTSTRFIVFDRQGAIVASAQREHQQIYPQPGWVEHDAREIWLRTRQVIEDVQRSGGIPAASIAALGITNQRETTVAWRRSTGEPVAPAIVWQDTRVSADVAEFLRFRGPDFFRERTGLPLSTYFSALKLRWLLKNVPGASQMARDGELLFGTIDTFLVWNLTGGAEGGLHITDVTNASRTQLMSIESLAWDMELLDLFEIPASVLPEIRSSSEVYGSIGDSLLPDVPIAGILGDQQAALVGQGCFRPGEAKNTYGTGCFLLLNTGGRPVRSRYGLLTTVAYRFGSSPACYALEGSIAVTGALVQWLRDNLGLIHASAEVETLARTVEDNGGVYFVPAFSGLYAPYWREDARGVVAGLTRFANRGHLARAALEATAYQTRDVVEAMEQDAGVRLEVLRADGGMVANNLLMQLQADILGRPVVCPEIHETTALGAACAAGLACGFYGEPEELRSPARRERTWQPRMSERRREQLYRGWKKAVERSFGWANDAESPAPESTAP